MKLLLTTIVLLSSIQYAFADMTLEFKELKSKSLITYSIKDKTLRFVQTGQSRVNLFNAEKQIFISFDPKTSKQSLIDQSVLDQRVSQLNKERLKKLAQVKKKMAERFKTMNSSEKDIGESLINLIQYPEIYGEHTQLQFKKTARSKDIEKIQCHVYQLYRNDDLLKDVCIADKKALNMQMSDYQTLRNLYAFDYAMQTRLMLAMGKTRFSLIDYAAEKVEGIVIESIDYQGANITQHLILNGFDSKNIDINTFSLPKIKPTKQE